MSKVLKFDEMINSQKQNNHEVNSIELEGV